MMTSREEYSDLIGEYEAQSSYREAQDAHTMLAHALDQYLKQVHPPLWHPLRYINLQQQREYVASCAALGWVNWYRDAIKLGADPDVLATLYHLTIEKPLPKAYLRR